MMTKSTKTTDEYLEEYKLLKDRYKTFASGIKFILEKLLRKNNIKYQTIAYRAKSEQSLKGKLEKPKAIKSIKESVKDINDLAGCRIILYLDRDIERVKQHLWDEFKIVKKKTKHSDDSYNASHLIVKLNNDRLKHSEYEEFNGLKCEIQLTTVLYHSWAELEHDVIYKREKSISEFDKPTFDTIKGNFSDVMKDHIKPAQHDFDEIFRKLENIKQEKQAFDVDSLRSIVDSKTNIEIYENLCNLLNYIEKFGDKTPKELNIIEVVNNILEKSKKLKKGSIKTVLGNFPSDTNIVVICLDILKHLKHVYPKEVFEILCRLSIDESKTTKEKALEIASEMATYIYNPQEKLFYYHPQLFLLNEIEKWNDKSMLTYLNLLTIVFSRFLSPSFMVASREGYKTATLHQGTLPADDTVKSIRERTVNILKKFYSLAETITEKQMVLRVLDQATHTSHHENSPALKKIILGNTNTIISYYLSIAKQADNEIIKIIDEQLYWFVKRFPSGLKNIKNLRLLIERNTEYNMYKVLVGWDYHHPDFSDWREANTARKQKIDEYIKQITDKNFMQWQKKILSVIKNYKQLEDQGQFQYFNTLLYELGKQKPDIALRLISENEKDLEPFLIHLIAGLWKSEQKEKAKKILKDWIGKSKHLSACAYIFGYVKEINEALLNTLYEKAKGQNNVNALTNIILSITSSFEQSKIGKDLFVACIKELKKHKNYQWINHVWYRENSILEVLNKNDWNAVLGNLLIAPDIDHRLGKILSVVAQHSPKKLIAFFYLRTKMQTKENLGIYDAIPYSAGELIEPLSQHAKVVIEEILKWCEKKDRPSYWRGGYFLRAIFPTFHTELEEQLIKLLRTKNKNNAKTVMHVLYSYRGETFLYNVCKEFIKQYPRNKGYKHRIFVVLSQMGVVKGDYGFVEGYERKKQEIQEWKKDRSKAIQNFVPQYENYLSERIDYEKKRIDEDTEF